MNKWLVNKLRTLLRRFGIDFVRFRGTISAVGVYPPDFSVANIEICNAVMPYTMTSVERINALIDAVRYVVANDIDGAIVECGVWKGGSAMATALALKGLGIDDRDIYLYDTFSGMPAPGENDVSYYGKKAIDTFNQRKTSEDSSWWAYSPIDEVRQNLYGTGYPENRIHFIEGKVEDTIPKNVPTSIALLRLDTDWYESTRHELVHLYPLLRKNGVLIIDDYGHFKGARKAVDDYLLENNVQILLNRIDYTGRVAIKTSNDEPDEN